MARILVLVTSSEFRNRWLCWGVAEWQDCWWQLEHRPAEFNTYRLGCFKVWDSEARNDVLHLDAGVQVGRSRDRGGLEYYLLKQVDDLISILKDNVLCLEPYGDDRAVILVRGDNSQPEEIKDTVTKICNLCRAHGHALTAASHSNHLPVRYSSSDKAGPWIFMMDLRYQRGEDANRVESFDRIWDMISILEQA
jgi:hypothetical protein